MVSSAGAGRNVEAKPEIRGLTLYQPWASAVAEGVKRWENRSWPPPRKMIGQLVAIHAGKTFDERSAPKVASLWRGMSEHGPFETGAILAVARIAGAVCLETPTDPIVGGSLRDREMIRSASTDPWIFGPWAWLLTDVKKLETPIPCRGRQRLWRLPEDVEVACLDLVARRDREGPCKITPTETSLGR